MSISNQIRINIGRSTSGIINPLLHNMAVKAELAHRVQKLIASSRFSCFEQIKDHLNQNGVTPDRAVAILARHPATFYSEENKIAGSEETTLSPGGIQQTLRLRSALSGVYFNIVLSSHRSRTAIPAARIAADFRRPFRQEPNLIEINCGSWHHNKLTRKDGGSGSIEAAMPANFALFQNQPHLWKAPGGESFWDVQNRTDAVMRRAVRENLGKAFLVIGHAWANGTIIARAFGIHLAHIHPLIDDIKPTAITVIEYSSDLNDNHLWLWADAGHLSDD